MVKFAGLIFLIVLCSSSLVFAQVQNQQIGGPIVPQGNNTVSQYCWNGTCQTPNILPNGTITGNDTANQEFKSKYNIIMVIPSELCTRAIENHLKTDCPSLNSLVKYDNSNQKISGQFIRQIDGTLTRANPGVKNHWQYYGYTNHTIVCVYCTGNYITSDLYKTIILEPASFEFVPHEFINTNYKVDIFNGVSGNYSSITFPVNEFDSGLTSYKNKSMQGCNSATIAYSDFLLNDTIKYLESDCKIKSYNQTTTQKVPNTPWQYDNPFSSLHYLVALKTLTHNAGYSTMNNTSGGHGPGNCINGCSYTTSTRKAGY